jgi:hypothetical protein
MSALGLKHPTEIIVGIKLQKNRIRKLSSIENDKITPTIHIIAPSVAKAIPK